MTQPWDSDHSLARSDLTTLLARSIETRRFTGNVHFESNVRPHWFAEGWDCDVFQVVDATNVPWLCKIPKRGAVQPWIEKEAGILEMLEQSGLGVAPRLGMRGQPGDLPYQWIGVSVVPGKALLHHTHEIDPIALGVSYGTLMRKLHELEPASMGDKPPHAIHRVNGLVEGSEDAMASVRKHLDRSSRPSLLRELRSMVARAATHVPEEVAPTFVHADLFPEHVFLDLQTSRVSSLIDWADACWGDPAIDFTMIGWILGDAFLESAITVYAPEDPEGMKRRVHRMAAMMSIHDVHVAEQGAPNVPLQQRLDVLQARAREGWLDRV